MAKEKRNATLAWLERSNPLRGLTISQANMIFDCARNGDTQRLHWMYQEIETQNPVLSMATTRRAGAAANFAWRVVKRAAMDGSLSAEQKDAAERFFGDIENLSDLFEHLDLALFRGFAHAQPIWEDERTVRHIELLDSWKFLKKDGEWLYNPACDGFSSNCVSCRDARLVTVERRRPVDVPALAIHLRAAVGSRDWGRFIERYALPKPAVVMAQNATEKDRDDYLESASALENGQVTVWPSGASLMDFAGSSRGVDPFTAFIQHQEKTILMLATGGTLGSMAESGAGTLAGNAQADVWDQIVSRDAGIIAQAIKRALLRPFLAAAFPGQPVAVDFDFDLTKKPTPKEIFETATAAKNAGYLVDQDVLEEETGWKLEKAPETPPPAPGFAMNSQPKPKTPLQTAAGAFKNAPSKPDGQGDPSALPPSQIAKKRPSATEAVLAELASTILDGSVPYEEALKRAQEQLEVLDPVILAGGLEKALEEAMFKAAAEAMEESRPSPTSQGEVSNSECRAQDPAHCPTHGTPREHHDKGYQDHYGNGNPETLAANPTMNIERGKAVISHIMGKKAGFEPHAMFRRDVGWIGVDYGNPGSGKNFDGGHGVSHVIAKHPGAIDGVVDILQTGTAYKHDESRRKIYLIKGRTAVVLSKNRENRLLITDFENLSDTQLREYTSKGKYHVKGENE